MTGPGQIADIALVLLELHQEVLPALATLAQVFFQVPYTLLDTFQITPLALNGLILCPEGRQGHRNRCQSEGGKGKTPGSAARKSGAGIGPSPHNRPWPLRI
jgi:hypothetical protein